jgi:YHS domain-containing protein
MIRRIVRLAAPFAVALAVLGPAAHPALAEKPQVFSSQGAAIHGYDPVAYHTAGTPTKGSAQFSHQWRGATWHFASAANRDAFAANPEKFAPQFGGYCAFGAAKGFAVETDPKSWRIVDGKLYLNKDQAVQSRWVQDIPGHIRDANANWPAVLKK